MLGGYTIGYLYYVITLFIMSGLFILYVDVKDFQKAKQKKEWKVSRFIGWFNLIIGFITLIGNWVI
ncbi:CLC_0170 family protein [Paenibacillus lupini]|uniref:CLC_0170 family protein n=1 Tax=Paenibacillus lupini TaxID=1450204 RepID=UPI001420DF90|nr:CLC_0170 family protein [Paenibacillus lupini]NIK22763.1 putative MFS family arabinose efflux permease [Paenibacillus lupini]